MDFCDPVCSVFCIEEVTFAQQYDWLDIAFFNHH